MNDQTLDKNLVEAWYAKYQAAVLIADYADTAPVLFKPEYVFGVIDEGHYAAQNFKYFGGWRDQQAEQ